MEPSSARSRQLAAYLYLADLLRDRRVLVIGCGSGEGAAHLADAGAREVVGVDPSARAIGQASSRFARANLHFHVGDVSTLEVEDGGADAVVLPDATDLLRQPGALDEVRRVLAVGGLLIVRVASGDRSGVQSGLSYHDVLERIGSRFGHVRMIGMAPFAGLSLVEFADTTGEPPELELDGSLAEGAGEIVDYVAVAGAPVGAPRGFLLVQLPPADGLSDLREALGGAAATPLSAGDDELRRKLLRAVEERTKLEAESLGLRRRVIDAENEVGRVTALAAKEIDEARRTSSGRGERRGGARSAPASTGTPSVRAGDLEAALARAEAEDRLAAARGEVAELRTQAADHAGLKADFAGQSRQIAKLEEQLEDTRRAAVKGFVALKTGEGGAPAGFLAEAGLRHEAEMRALAAELEERDAFVDELRGELDTARQEASTATRANERLRTELTETEARLADARTRAARAEGELMRHARGGGPLPADLGTAGAGASPATSAAQAGAAEEAAEKARASVRAAEAKNDELWRKIGEMQKELEANRERSVETARQQRQGAQLALTRAMDEAGKKLVSVREEAVRAERDRKGLEEEVRARRAELDEVRRALEATMAAREATRGDLEAYRVESTQSFLALRGEIEAARRESRQDVERAELERDRAVAALRLGRAEGLDAGTVAGLEELEELGRILAAGLREAELRIVELEAGLTAAARATASPAP